MFQAVAYLGNPTAMANLGVFYRDGLGVPQDYVKAREWLEKAAKKGDVGAMRNLGFLYLNGEGVARDNGKAREWFAKADAQMNAILGIRR